MTKEQVEKGKDLLIEIERLEEQKLKWQNADKIHCIKVKGNFRGGFAEIDRSTINFYELRLFSLAKIDEMMKAKQEELDKL